MCCRCVAGRDGWPTHGLADGRARLSVLPSREATWHSCPCPPPRCTPLACDCAPPIPHTVTPLAHTAPASPCESPSRTIRALLHCLRSGRANVGSRRRPVNPDVRHCARLAKPLTAGTLFTVSQVALCERPADCASQTSRSRSFHPDEPAGAGPESAERRIDCWRLLRGGEILSSLPYPLMGVQSRSTGMMWMRSS